MRRTLLLALAVPLLLAVGAPRRAALAPLGFHDNDRPAGRLANGELSLALEIRRGLWTPNGPDRPGTPMLAFAERGQPARVPGPLIRVRQGTRVRVTITNTSDSTIVLRGLADDPTQDSLLLVPGASGERRFTASEPGNRFYHGAFPGRTMRDRRTEDGHLAGAIIVDAATPPGARPPLRDEVLLITLSFHSVDSLGRLNSDRESYGVNGRPWPRTQRFTAAVGDSMRFRVINATRDVHPIHLHGVYFRVDARGGALRDTTLAVEDRRMVVTEFMPPGSTMSIAWMPERPGTWLLHCHLTFHLTPNIGFGADSVPPPEYAAMLRGPHGNEQPGDHVERGMGGIMVAILVPPPPGWRLPAEPARRVVRLIVPRDSVDGERAPYFTPSIESDGARSAPSFGRDGPGATLFLRRGEPTAVWVVNESNDHTAIHWHGMELDSRFDGVVGLGGTPGDRQRAIAPRDSFEARMTPPRAGTFIYHTHLMEVRQQAGGLYGAMLVLPPGESFDPVHDHVFIAGTSRVSGALLNGRTTAAPLEFEAGGAHRLRLINITTGSPGLRFFLVRADSSLVSWQRIAKDGMDLPANQRTTVRADQPVAMGETYDMRFTAAAAGEYRLELRTAANVLVATQPIRVVPRRP